jgi:tRNA dimethylallyltransferase
MEPFPVAIVGPTAVGKSSLALALAPLFNGEIVSVDSMQVYRSMDIGTAKPGARERKAVRHHLLDIVDPHEEFSVAEYQRLARNAVDDILSRGGTPFLVGGTGLYMRAVLDEMVFSPPNQETRRRFESMSREEAPLRAFRELSERDPATAERLGAHNLRRLVRALEVIETAEDPLSILHRSLDCLPQHYPRVVIIGLHAERTLLNELIDERVEKMFEMGLVDEVRKLLEGGRLSRTAGQALGYRQVCEYLDNKISLEETVLRTKTASRRFAKRQMTWFRRDPRIRWLGVDREDIKDPKRVVETAALWIGEARRDAGKGAAL